MSILEVRVAPHLVPPDLVLSHTIRAATNAGLVWEFRPVSGSDNSVSVLFFSLSGDFTEFEAALADDPTVTSPTLVADYGERRVYRVPLTDRAKLVTPKPAEVGVQLLDGRSTGDGWLVRAVFPTRETLTEFGAFCSGEGIAFDERAMYRKEGADIRGG